MLRWLAMHRSQRPTPFAVETVGAPSGLVSFRAHRLFAQAEGAGGPYPGERPFSLLQSWSGSWLSIICQKRS